MATQTDNYNLDLYETGDAAALTDQYNSAMHKIDNDLKTFNQGITSASQQAANAKKAADANTATLNALGADSTSNATALKTKIDTTATTADANTAKLNALGATDTSTATALKNKIDTTATTANANKANLNALGVTNTTNANDLKNKINTTATTADANTAKLNALGVTDTNTATALKTKINTTATNLDQNYYTKTQSDAKYVLKPTQQTNLVAIGDSYFEGFRTNNPATDSMIVKASNMLGLTCKNFAAGGSGFITKTTFSQQLDIAHNSVNPDTVKYVVIGGGRNDPHDTLTENTVRDTLNKAKTLFPKSQVVFIPLMWDNTYPTEGDSQKYGTMLAGARKANTWTVQNAVTWGLYNYQVMTDIHPNTEGSEIYAQYIATAIQNNMTIMSRQGLHKDVTLKGVRDGGKFQVTIDGLTVHMIFRGYLEQWNHNAFAIINKPENWGVYQIITGFNDRDTMIRLKFNGHEVSVIDVWHGATDGGPAFINFSYSFSVFQKL